MIEVICTCIWPVFLTLCILPISLPRPTQDYIPPHSTRICKIVLSRMSEYPDLTDPKKGGKDKFLVQSTIVQKEVSELSKMVSEGADSDRHKKVPDTFRWVLITALMLCILYTVEGIRTSSQPQTQPLHVPRTTYQM